jgi:transmembrane sensor
MAAGDGQRQLEREAHEWLARLTSGRATAADAEALRHWCERSSAHAEALAEATLLWESLAPAAREVASRSHDAVPAKPPATLGRRAVLAGGLAAAAASAVYAMLRPPFELWPSIFDLAADYRTGIGERRQIALEGGVSVELNTRTSLNIRAAANASQHIELVSGEAAVATGGVLANPLVVAAAGGRVIASDAKFDLRCDGAVASVACLQGAVNIEYQGGVAALAAREQLAYGNGRLGSTAAVDPATVTSWREGRLVFHGVPLARVIEEVNRYRSGRIILLNSALGRRTVDATFPTDRTDDVVTLVRRAYGAEVTTLPGGVVIVS